MKRNTMVRKWLAALLCACLVFSHFGWMTSAKAAGNAVANLTGSDQTDDITLLAGASPSEVRGSTLEETILNYRARYALGVAADFCVFLKDYFWPTESDAEGRVAVGGNIYADAQWAFNYSIGVGDYWWHTPLDELLVADQPDGNGKPVQNRLGAATVILGGYLYGNLNDTYYKYDSNKIDAPEKPGGDWDTGDADNTWRRKYEGAETGEWTKYDNHHNVIVDAEEKTTKKIVLNMDLSTYSSRQDAYISTAHSKGAVKSADETYTPYWPGTDGQAVDTASIKSESKGRYQKIDQSQTYVAPLINFQESFDYLYLISNEMAKAKDDFTVTVTDKHVDPKNRNAWVNNETNSSGTSTALSTIVFEYQGDNTPTDCVYLTLTHDEWLAFEQATYVEFKNIPSLPDSGRKVVEVKTREGGVPKDEVYLLDWTPAHVIINVMETGEVRIANLAQDRGQKYTTINGTYISRHGPNDSGADAASRNNHAGVTCLLYNFPKATMVVLGNNFQGTIFAPHAHVTDWFTKNNYTDQDARNYNASNRELRGHLSGALIADSFKGATEFGYRPFTGSALMISGDLAITKRVEGEGADKNKEFEFVVKIEPKVTKKYGDMNFVDGVATVKLKDGETKTAKDLMVGTKYTVTETATSDYKSGVVGGNAEGTIVIDQVQEVEFVNTYDVEAKYGDLSVTKSVTGDGADLNKEFRFTVSINQRLTQRFGDMSFVNGIATFTLKHGETKKATGLPVGITYTVIEEDAAGYVTTKTGDTGTIADGQEAKAIFVNAYDSAKDDSTTDDSTTGGNDTETNVPKTGDGFPMQLWLGLMAIALIGMCVMVRKIRKS